MDKNRTKRRAATCLGVVMFGLAVAACSQQSAPPAKSGPAAGVAASPSAALPPDPQVEAINSASFLAEAETPSTKTATAVDTIDVTAEAVDPATYDPMLIKAQVLLDRARFSPGVIDGKDGTNLRHALMSFQTVRGLPVSGDLDQATWAALTADMRPVAETYRLVAADVSGPFSPDVGEDLLKMADLNTQGYTRATEGLAERFHMDEDFLKALNPAVDFKTAGVSIVVVAAGAAPLAKGDVDHIEVSKQREQVTAFDSTGKVLAVYPATVGSRERPSPSGVHKVKGVARNPDYTYDPAKLSWGPRSKGKLLIAAGPNNPVGSVWIDLDRPSYGIHGSADPKSIGKTGSHGCVRLANWDAVALADGVRPGVTVRFVQTEGSADDPSRRTGRAVKTQRQ